LRALLFFDPEHRGVCLRRVARVCRSRGIEISVVEDRGVSALIEVSDLSALIDAVRDVDCVTRVARVLLEMGLEPSQQLAESIARRVAPQLRGRSVAVRVRRWFKEYPATSIDIARLVAAKLAEHGVEATPRAGYTLLICIDRGRAIVTELVYERVVEAIPRSIAKRLCAVACSTQTPYEVADLIQMCRAMDIELRLYRPRREAVDEALKHLGMGSLPPNTSICSSLDELRRGIDAFVVLSQHAKRGERALALFVKRFGGRIALVVGNEYSDPPPEIEELAQLRVRLGPATGMPMRSCIALAYAAAIALGVMAGVLEPSPNEAQKL